MTREQAVTFSQKFIEDVLTFFELNIAVSVQLVGDIIEVDVPHNSESRLLIGRNAETLRCLQHLLSAALQAHDSPVARVNVDIADYKKQRAQVLADKARGWMQQVRETGQRKEVSLNPADRRTVHHVAEEFSDISTHSEGEGRDRVLVIEPAA